MRWTPCGPNTCPICWSETFVYCQTCAAPPVTEDRTGRRTGPSTTPIRQMCGVSEVSYAGVIVTSNVRPSRSTVSGICCPGCAAR